MSATTDAADAAIAQLEAEEQGLVNTDEDKQDDSSQSTDEKDAGNTDDKAKSEDKDTEDEADAGDKQQEADEEGEFTADDAPEVEEVDQPTAPTDANNVQLSPAEQKYLADNIEQIGEPVVFTGKVGDKEVSYKVYDVNQLPDAFVPDSVVAFNKGVSRINAMNDKAQSMLNDYRANQSQAQARDFEQRENEGIRLDVADLQKEGRFPKFKVAPGTPGFDDDPAAQQMAEVLKVMAERNQLYLEQFNQGRPYRHIGFTEAFDIWERSQPKTATKSKEDAAQDKEDAERKRKAETPAANQGQNPNSMSKAVIPRGTTVRDILNRLDADDSW